MLNAFSRVAVRRRTLLCFHGEGCAGMIPQHAERKILDSPS
jgi:hypothetical protein